jgi:hypothetical protein
MTFRTGPQWLEGNLSFTRGMGSNRTPDGMTGRTEAWNGQASLSSSFGWVTLSAGKDRSRSRDQILDFGNTDVNRNRASIQMNPGRVTLVGSWEDSVVERGRENTFAWVWQRVGSATLSVPLSRATLTANAGAFTNTGFLGRDTSVFWGGALEAELARSLHLSTWIRYDKATATQASLDQAGVMWLVLAEYRIRDFTLGAEYRNTRQDLKSSLQNAQFQGRQMLIRVSRKVNVPL